MNDCVIEETKEEELSDIADMIFEDEIGKKYYPTKDVFLDMLKSGIETDQMFTAKGNGGPMGFLWFQNTGAFYIYPYLQLIFVKPEYRKKQLGKKLIDYLEDYSLNKISNKKLKNKIFLCVANWNEGAMEFYKNSGYIKVGEIPDLFRKNITENLYMKECVRKK